MARLTLRLYGAREQETFAAVASFVGRDASGQFGILPGRAPLVTVLEPGLARFRVEGAPWRYLGLPRATLWLEANGTLHVAARRYVIGDDPRVLRSALEASVSGEADQVAKVRASLQQLEQAMIERLWRLGNSP